MYVYTVTYLKGDINKNYNNFKIKKKNIENINKKKKLKKKYIEVEINIIQLYKKIVFFRLIMKINNIFF